MTKVTEDPIDAGPGPSDPTAVLLDALSEWVTSLALRGHNSLSQEELSLFSAFSEYQRVTHHA